MNTEVQKLLGLLEAASKETAPGTTIVKVIDKVKAVRGGIDMILVDMLRGRDDVQEGAKKKNVQRFFFAAINSCVG